VNLPKLKCDAPPELVEQVRKIEERCDSWADNLTLLSFSYDVAAWGVLTQIIDLIEQQIRGHGHGSPEQRDAMINLGLAGALLLDRLRSLELPTKDGWLRWTQELKDASKDAVLSAHNCMAFISCFTTWHQDRRAISVLSPTQLRFTVQGSSVTRRINAYQQGRRLPDWPSTPDNPTGRSFVDDPDVNQLLFRLYEKVTFEGALAIRYPNDSELLSYLRDIDDERLRRDFRRNPSLDLGGYDLTEFRKVFAVLVSVCSVHEWVCGAWEKNCGRYPFESAVLVKSVSEWTSLIASLSHLDEGQVRLMLSDLTFGTIRPLDIYIHPFVPSLDAETLSVIPHVILNSRPEENILRVCALKRPKCYRPIANLKEEEMRDGIKAKCAAQYSVFGPLKLPDPKLPDIDIIVKDRESSILLVGEVKWLRKPTHVIDQPGKDAELEEGFRQLKDVRGFLERCPDFLSDRGILQRGQRPLLSFAVIARDHLTETRDQGDTWIAEYDALLWALNGSNNLGDAIRKLQASEWLPVEGRDFVVQFEPASLAGVTIESEVFHRVRIPK
jgi:hypothetical protein